MEKGREAYHARHEALRREGLDHAEVVKAAACTAGEEEPGAPEGLTRLQQEREQLLRRVVVRRVIRLQGRCC